MWIKLWVKEIIHGSTLKELDVEERAVWFELLCLAGDSITPGKICISEEMGYTTDQLCHLLKINSKLLQRGLQVLEKVGKIKRNGANIIEVCNFVEYQGSEEDIEKRREYMANYMKSYRKKHKSDPPVDTE